MLHPKIKFGNKEGRVSLSTIIKQVSKKQGDNLYDLVKIKVHFEEHFYIFSRFSICRMLTLCRVKKVDAIKIAKAIKKQLIESNRLEVSQQELQSTIFETMKLFGYENSILKYQMVARFYGQRTPMIILVLGAPCIGKSLIANNLAERLNVSNVLQTTIVESVMKELDSQYLQTLKPVDDVQDNKEELINVFKNNCRVIRKGVQVDIQKCLTEGKPVIIEGVGLIPELYIEEQTNIETPNYDIIQDPQEDQRIQEFISQYVNNDIKLKKIQRKDQNLFNSKLQIKKKWKIVIPEPDIGQDLQQIQREIQSIKDLNNTNQRQALTIAFHLILNKQDHLYNLENNLPRQVTEDHNQVEKRLESYQELQNFLLTQRSKCQIIPVNLHNLEETLDTMHDVILEKIEAGFKRGDF